MPVSPYIRLPTPGVVRNTMRIPPLPPSGWRRTAAINAILTAVLLVIVVSFLIATANIGGSVLDHVVFWSGSCSTASTINLTLHLLLNIVSTAILASSNFFMQVLASPSRYEVDAAHAKKTWVDIGIPSIRNLRFLSFFKVAIWVMFTLTSVPIHLVFNSSIFEINYAGGNFTMTLVAESFLNGSAYYPPGASLLTGSDTYSSSFNDSSDTSLYLRSTAANASNTWKKLSADKCNEYINTCQPLTNFKDIVVVVTSARTTNFLAEGWVPSEIFNMSTNFNLTKAWEMDANCRKEDYSSAEKSLFLSDLNISASGVGNYGDFWTQHIPLDSPNSLWFTSNCSKFLAGGSRGSEDFCRYDCDIGVKLPFDSSLWEDLPLIFTSGIDDFPYYGYLQPPPSNLTIYDTTWPFYSSNCSSYNIQSIYRTAIALNTTYCLAEPFDSTCMIGASGSLLLTIAVCVLLKLILSVTVLCRLKEPMLVTPGDAIASFIQNPDLTTAGSVTLLPIRPRPWRKLSWSGYTTVPMLAWMSSYFLIGGTLVAVCVLYTIAVGSEGLVTSSLRPINDFSMLQAHMQVSASVAILIANSPQIALTLCYFTYNALFTRLVMAREWFSYAGAARPLRVTDPHGEQVSTYRLQLPYHYSVPLLVLSIGLHWMVSNTLYIFMYYGEFYSYDYGQGYEYGTTTVNFTLVGVPADIDVSGLQMKVGFSALPILITLITAAVCAPVPLFLGLWKIKDSNMVGFPGRSVCISAACHVSTAAAFPECDSPSPCSLSDSSHLGEHNLEPEQLQLPSLQLLPFEVPLLQGDADIEMSDLGAASRVNLTSPSVKDRRGDKQNDGHRNDSMIANSKYQSETRSNEQTEAALEKALAEERSDRLQISYSLLRWGEVQMPQSFYERWADSEEPVGHLSFGTKGQWLGKPREGCLYI